MRVPPLLTLRNCLLTLPLLAAACHVPEPVRPAPPQGMVGRRDDGSQMTPVNQLLPPHGTFVDLPGLRPQAIARSPDGRHLYVSGKTSELLVLDAETGAIAQRVALPNDEQTVPVHDPNQKELRPDRDGQLSYTGLVVAADGRTIYMSSVRGSIKVFAVAETGAVKPSHTLPLPPAMAPRRNAEIPSGLSLSADGSRLYVCGNLSDQLFELDTGNGEVLRTFAVGVAPFDVVLLGQRAFVSNQGGRRPATGDLIGPAGRGTVVRVDPVRDIASEGSVSVLDLATGELVAETITGLHASDLAVDPGSTFVACANAGSDTVTLLDRDGKVIDVLCARAKPSDLLQASPNALCFSADGELLFVANGTMNAIAVFELDDRELLGLVPVGWYPSALLFDAGRNRLAVTNVKGLGHGRPRKGNGEPEFNSHQYHGSVSLVPVPGDDELAALSLRVDLNLRRAAIEHSLLPPRSGQPARVIPERIGEPSRIRHVVYVIKENRTYDQVLGDLEIGNGDPGLCVFGERVTPNQHALARQFVLLDNTYCAGILSADGHQWSTAAFASDYLEKSFAGWPRSYPDGMGEDEADALSYSPAGFLWDHAIAHGISLRNYGEFCAPAVHWRDPGREGRPDFMACYRAWRGDNDDVVFGCEPSVRSLGPYTPSGYVGWDMSVPDQFRADFVIRELAEFERKGEFPQLVLICLPNDHTSGTSKNCPTPAACLADGDLAFGRIVEALSHSSFWPEMAIFGIEDDPQAGWDHVSGYRTTCFLASPFARRGAVVSSQYNTTSVLRTIEQILGIPPMNVFDASAEPMFDCFTEAADPTPFVALPNNVPLDQLNPGSTAIADPQLRADAELSATFDFAHIDRAPEDALNRILWRAMRGSAAPYPEWAVTRGAADDDEPAEQREDRHDPL
ncbi:MAG: bifunctional YncE family protein/alkaline phosphatase family protein [Planctomycetes bacterium]|nr:bifunctional YncE family protein/alkaline phosphatase family protein [Planctomycetota bacterium]